MCCLLNTKEQYKVINSLQGMSLYSYKNYLKYHETALQEKEKIISLLGGHTRVSFKIDDSKAIQEQSERDFKTEFKDRYRSEFGVGQGFFKLAAVLNSSNILENRHSSGKKVTKVLGEIEELGEKVVLMYSQIKNSYILPNESYLVISVDPYDFITMGVGKGWTTCYRPMGEHYSGSFSLGQDKVSFLTFVTTSKPDFSSTNWHKEKIYRRLGVFTSSYDGIKLSTQYPYKNNGIESFTIDSLIELFKLGEKESLFVGDYSGVKVYKRNLSQIYNDFTFAIKTKKEETYIGPIGKKEVVRYGSVLKCLECSNDVAFDDMPICNSCEIKNEEKLFGRTITYDDRK